MSLLPSLCSAVQMVVVAETCSFPACCKSIAFLPRGFGVATLSTESTSEALYSCYEGGLGFGMVCPDSVFFHLEAAAVVESRQFWSFSWKL